MANGHRPTSAPPEASPVFPGARGTLHHGVGEPDWREPGGEAHLTMFRHARDEIGDVCRALSPSC